MLYDQRSPLSRYAYDLLCNSRTAFAAKEAEQAIGVGHGAFLDAAERLQRRKALVQLRQGFYAIVPPIFVKWGAPTPDYYIDDLMRHEGKAYYVGLLKAGYLHGATHQAIMEFQVVTNARLPKIYAGRNRIFFYYRKDMEAVAEGIDERMSNSGRMMISSPALTALDLLRYWRPSGGIHFIATMLVDLAKKIDPGQLAELSKKFERPIVQRLGNMLDRLGHEQLTAPMLEALRKRGHMRWVELEPWAARSAAHVPQLGFGVKERDPLWRVVTRNIPEPDDI